MSIPHLNPRRTGIAIAGLVALLVLLPAVFAAANTVPASKAGDGTNTVSGYTVSNIVYTLNGSDPTKIDAVLFDLNTAPPAAATMKVRLVSTGTDWYTCTNVTTAMTCDTTSPQATVATADELRVIVAQ